MKVKAVLKRCLELLFERNYCLDKWMGDETLLCILHDKFGWNEIDKWYINRWIPSIKPQKIIIHTRKERNLKYNNIVVTRVYFYYFSKSYDSIPTQNTKEEWTNIYFNFRQLRTTHKEDNLINSKRKRDDNQHDSLFDSYDVVAKANPPVSQKKLH